MKRSPGGFSGKSSFILFITVATSLFRHLHSLPARIIMQDDRRLGPDSGSHTAMPQHLWPSNPFKLMQLLQGFEMAGSEADLPSIATHYRFNLTK
jgi:hypothetical protein